MALLSGGVLSMIRLRLHYFAHRFALSAYVSAYSLLPMGYGLIPLVVWRLMPTSLYRN